MIISMMTAYSQNWNLVWNEDFGVVEDSVIRDFPDPSMSVPGHQFGACEPIADGWYGITNSPWWAYNRKASCAMGSAAHFTGGADHTGNPNGGMLVVNVDKTGHGEAIYRQKMKFQVCGQRKYRFSIYAAAVSNSLSSIDLPILAMRIVNQDGDVLAEQSTGKIPLWEFNNPNDGTHVHEKKDWSEYNLEFVAQEGDELELQVLNYCVKDYLGNDFALDDISLYRDDSNKLVEPELLASDAVVDCEGGMTYSVKNNILSSWKAIYDYVYFLWQESTDNGYTWKNLEDVSGIKKTSMFQEGKNLGERVYRLIVTGGNTEQEASDEAHYISTHGGPSNGCVYYSVSNSISHFSRIYDCSLQPSLRRIWREDFGTIDSLKTRTFDAIGGDYQAYESGQTTRFDEGAYYTVTCAPDSTVYALSSDGSTNDYSEPYQILGVTGEENDAFLYTNIPVGQQVMVVDKLIPGKVCPCQSYVLSVNANGLDLGDGVYMTLSAQDERGVRYMEMTYSVPSNQWGRFEMPLSLYADEVFHMKVFCQNVGTQPAKVAFDDIQFLVCSDHIPQAEIGIDGDPNKKYEGIFNCNDLTENHTIHLYSQEWDDKDEPYVYIWQTSFDGIHWTSLPSNSKVIQYDNMQGGSVMYRAILALTNEVAQQVAQNGYPDSYCDLFYITTPVTISCKGCQKPKFSPLGQTENTLCGGPLVEVIIEAKTTPTSIVDQYYWFEKSPHDTEWTAIPTPEEPNILKATTADSMQYLFYATNEDCVSDSIIYQLNIIPVTVLEPLNDTVMCEGGSYTLNPVVLRGNPTEFYVNSEPVTMPYVIENIRGGKIISLTASDGNCTSLPVNMEILAEDSIRYTEYPSPMILCPNTDDYLYLDVIGSYTSAVWKKDGVALTDNELADKIHLTESATFELVAEGNKCPSVHYSFDVVKLNDVKLSFITPEWSACEGDQVALALNDQNISNLTWEQMKKGETSFTPISSGTGAFLEVTATDTIYYRARVSVGAGCDDVYSDTAVVYAEKKIPLPAAYTGPTTICYGEKITFVKDPQLEGFWTKKADILPWENQGSQAVVEDTPSEQTVYTYYTDNKMCPREEMSVKIDVERRADLAPERFSLPSSVCEDEAFEICAFTTVMLGGPYDVVWYKGADSQTSNLCFSDSITTATQYTFLAKGNVCPDTSRIFTVEVNKRPTVSLSASETTVCEAGDVTFTATSSETKDLTWQKKEEGNSDFTTIETSTTTEQTWQMNTSATYRVIASSLYGCASDTSDYLSVNVEKLGTLSPSDFSVPTLVCEGGEVQLMPLATLTINTPFAWKKGTETLTTTELNYVDQLTEDAQYEFSVKGNACPEASITFDVQVEKRPTVTLDASETFVCEASDVTFTATSHDAKDLTWQRMGEEDSNFTTIETSTTATQTWQMNATAVYRVMANPTEVCEPAVSDPITVQVERTSTLSTSDFDVPTLVCEGEAVTLTVLPTLALSGTFAWKKGAETLTTTDRTYTDHLTADAQYEFSVKGAVCPESSVTFDVKVEKRPTVSLSASETFVCEGTDVTFSATATDAKDLTWQKQEDEETDFTTIETSAVTEQTKQMNVRTAYRVIANPLEVCEPVTSDPVVVEVEPKIEFFLRNMPTRVCENSEIRVILDIEPDVSVGFSHRCGLSRNGVVQAPLPYPYNDVITEKTTYLVITRGSVCPNDTNQYVVDIVPRLSIQLEGSADSLCANEPLDLSISYGTDLDSAMCPRLQVRREGETSYATMGAAGDCIGNDFHFEQVDTSLYVRVITEGGACPDTFSNELFIHVDQPNEVKLLAPSVCQGEKAMLKLEGVHQYTNIEWSSADTTVSGGERLEVQPMTDTEYHVEVVNGACENEASGTVHVQPYPVILSCEELAYDQYQVKVESPSSALVYDYGKGETTSDILEHAIVGVEYHIVVKDEVGCADTFIFKPTVELFIPEYFVEGRETWKVLGLDKFARSYYYIFDRYGKLLYRGSGLDDGWDGYYLGHPMPSTDYWYDIHIPEIDREYSGHFTLLRQK